MSGGLALVMVLWYCWLMFRLHAVIGSCFAYLWLLWLVLVLFGLSLGWGLLVYGYSLVWFVYLCLLSLWALLVVVIIVGLLVLVIWLLL